MLEVAVATALLAALSLVVGASSALALRREIDGRVAVLVDSVLHGLVWVPLAVTFWAWAGCVGAVAVLALWVASAVLAWKRRGAWPGSRRRPVRREVLVAVAWVVVLALALLVRLRQADFLPWVGDMGAYVNWANELARTGELRATWPPLLSADLAVASAALGSASTTIGVPFMGMCLVVAVGRVVQQVTGAWVPALAAGAATALQLHAVWYSSFPASESLNAPVLLVWLLLIHRLFTGAGRATAVGAAAVMLSLALLRGNAPLVLLPLTVVLAVAWGARSWRTVLPGAWAAWWASLVGSVVGYWYGIAEIHRYFVSTQLAMMFPSSVLDALDTLRLTRPAVSTAVALVAVVVGALVVGGRLVAGRVAAPVPAGHGSLPGVLLVLTAAGWVAVVVWQVAAGGDVAQILSRMGWILVLGAVVGLVVVARVGDVPAQALALLGGALALFYLVLHATRLGSAREHSFYLYWDRYLVSEVLPIALVLTFVAVAWAGRLLPVGAVRARSLPARAAACVVVVALVVVPGAGQLRIVTSEVFMRGAHEFTLELSDAVDAASEGRDLPVVWSADSTAGVDRWFFPNTWMAFAVPLERTFGHEVLNIPSTGNGFLPDRVVGAQSLSAVAACTGNPEMVLLDVRTGGPAADVRIDEPGVRVEFLGAHQGVLQLLGQPAGNGWYSATFVVDVWKVSLDRLPPMTFEQCTYSM